MPPPTRNSNTLAILILGGVAILGGAAILGVILSFRSGMDTSSDAIVAGNRFIDNMGSHNYPAAASLLSPWTQARISTTELKDMETLLEKRYGPLTNHGHPSWFVQTYNGQTSVRLSYMVQFTKGNSPLGLVLMKGNKGYQVEDIHYEL
jgi:hypothetical protein